MASNSSSSGSSGPEGVGKLRAPTGELLAEAESKPAFRAAQDKAMETRIAQAMEEQMSRPTAVHTVSLHGVTNLRRGFLDPIVSPLVSDGPDGPTTFLDVQTRLQQICQKLGGLQLFREAPQVYLSQTDQAEATSGPMDLNVDIKLLPLSSFRLQTGTDVGNGEGSAYGSVLWRNMFGGAEMLTLNAKAGTRTRSAYSANLSAPVLSNPDMRISLEGLASAAEKPWASHEEVMKGGSLKFSWLAEERDVHSVEYAGTWRQITGLAGSASPSVRGDAGDTLKSAIKHTFQRERRDNPQLPQTGYMVKTALELAGVGPLGGDVGFSKGEVEVGGAVPVPLPGIKQRTGISVGGGLRMGMLWPLPLGMDIGGKALPSRINDRFQLGGPTDVRGFSVGGLGPHDGADSVGGDLFAAGSVNMLLPLPYRGPDSSLRFQLFANGGRLVALRPPTKTGDGESPGMDASATRSGMLGAVGELVNGVPSMAAGVGLVYAHPVARFELNFSLPLVLRRGEVGTKGFQVGVGINFL